MRGPFAFSVVLWPSHQGLGTCWFEKRVHEIFVRSMEERYKLRYILFNRMARAVSYYILSVSRIGVKL